MVSRHNSVDVDDLVVEALYERGISGANAVIKFVRKRIKNVSEQEVRQCYEELAAKQTAMFGA